MDQVGWGGGGGLVGGGGVGNGGMGRRVIWLLKCGREDKVAQLTNIKYISISYQALNQFGLGLLLKRPDLSSQAYYLQFTSTHFGYVLCLRLVWFIHFRF